MIGSDPDWDLKHQLRTTEDNKEETGAGVYILSKNFIIALKRDKSVVKIFIIAPNLHVVCNGIS